MFPGNSRKYNMDTRTPETAQDSECKGEPGHILEEGELAQQVYQEQLQYGWPGLAVEVQEICDKIGVPDAKKNHLTKKGLSQALRNHDKAELVKKMTDNYKKLDKIKLDDPTIAKEYMERKSRAGCRFVFKMRTEMINLKNNMKNM